MLLKFQLVQTLVLVVYPHLVTQHSQEQSVQVQQQEQMDII